MKRSHGLTWAELAALRQPKTWAQIAHGEKAHSFVARRLRDRLVEAEDAGLVRYCAVTRTWGLTPKGLEVVDEAA